MRVRAACHFYEFLNDVLWCGSIRVAHTKIDNILSLRTSLGFEVIDDVEDVRRKSSDPWKVFVHESDTRGRQGETRKLMGLSGAVNETSSWSTRAASKHVAQLQRVTPHRDLPSRIKRQRGFPTLSACMRRWAAQAYARLAFRVL